MNREELTGTALDIVEECDFIAEMLLDKNRKYGDSALNPVRIFSRANPVEQLLARIDDKISRIKSAQDDDLEDAEEDLIGYLILLQIARRRSAVKESLTVAPDGEGQAGSARIQAGVAIPVLAPHIQRQVENLGFLAGRNQEELP